MNQAEKMLQKIRCIDGFQLKLIAIITMTIDHIGAICFPYDMTWRMIGRLSFPIFCFLIVEGATHTRDIIKYVVRLLLFAIISEVVFDYAFFGNWIVLSNQNIFFTLAIGVIAIMCMQNIKYIPISVGAIVALIFLADFLGSDYGSGGVLLIVLIYLHREKPFLLIFDLIFVNVLIFGGIQSYASFAIVPILLYNGER